LRPEEKWDMNETTVYMRRLATVFHRLVGR
jgi:hypothetical protein